MMTLPTIVQNGDSGTRIWPLKIRKLTRTSAIAKTATLMPRLLARSTPLTYPRANHNAQIPSNKYASAKRNRTPDLSASPSSLDKDEDANRTSVMTRYHRPCQI